MCLAPVLRAEGQKKAFLSRPFGSHTGRGVSAWGLGVAAKCEIKTLPATPRRMVRLSPACHTDTPSDTPPTPTLTTNPADNSFFGPAQTGVIESSR